MASEDLSTNDIEMYKLDDNKPEINYKRINELVEDTSKIYPNIDKFVLWVLDCDYYLKEELKLDVKDNEEYQDIHEKCKAEYKRTKEYVAIKVEDILAAEAASAAKAENAGASSDAFDTDVSANTIVEEAEENIIE